MCWTRIPVMEDTLKDYVAPSLVESIDNLLPYAMGLFKQGMPPGLHLLMEFLRGKSEVKDLKERWRTAEQTHKQTSWTSHYMKYACLCCSWAARKEVKHPLEAFADISTGAMQRTLSTPCALRSCRPRTGMPRRQVQENAGLKGGSI